jgi:ComF family protein
MKTSFLTELLDFVSPRACAICGQRLPAGDLLLCPVCLLHLPLTNFAAEAYDNPMVRLFWGQFPIEKASAWFYYRSHSDPSKMIYDLKYHGQMLLGEDIGEQIALRHQPFGFFDDIDAIVPVPITRRRQWKRGYNQSMQVAKGISYVTHLPIYNKVVKRQHFSQSQTHQTSIWERRENVRAAFQLVDADKIKGKHLLIIDDVVTTGATVIACGQELAKAEGVKLSVLSIGYTKE